MLIVMMKNQSYRGGEITGACSYAGLYIGNSLHISHDKHSVYCLNFCHVVVVL